MTYQQYPGGVGPSGQPQDGVPGSFGYQQGYLQPQRPPKRPVWPWIVGGLVFLCLLLFGGCAFFVSVYLGSPSDVASSYAYDLEDRDIGSAHDRLCAASQAQIPLGDFANDYFPTKQIEDVEILDDLSLSETEAVTETFVAEVTYEDGTSELLPHDLVKEDGKWRVCNPPRPIN